MKDKILCDILQKEMAYGTKEVFQKIFWIETVIFENFFLVE